MMIGLYKYLAMGGIALALLVAAFFFGHHEGALAGHAQVASLKAAIAIATATATAQAKTAQTAADAQTQTQLEAALQTANMAVVAHNLALDSLRNTIAQMRSQVQANENSSSQIRLWGVTPIPAGALTGLCFPARRDAPPNCDSHQNPVSAGAPGTH